MIFHVSAHVTLKPVVNDPQGLTVRDGLQHLGFTNVVSARVGKMIDLEIDAGTADAAKESVRQMCDKLLCNTVIEEYTISCVSE